jgi:hypothetical protein
VLRKAGSLLPGRSSQIVILFSSPRFSFSCVCFSPYTLFSLLLLSSLSYPLDHYICFFCSIPHFSSSSSISNPSSFFFLPFLSVSPSIFLSVSLSLPISLSIFLYVSLSPYLSISFSLSVSLYLPLSFSLSLPFSLSLSLSLSLSVLQTGGCCEQISQ